MNYLNSDNNKIINIEVLCSMHFLCLQQLVLSDLLFLFIGGNKISQIKCFNKLKTPFLRTIDLGNCFNLWIDLNPINEINALTKSQINSKRLESLYL
jgi:hypothetical protein